MHGKRYVLAFVTLALLGGVGAAWGAEAWSLKFDIGSGPRLEAETAYGYYPVKGAEWTVLDIAKATPPRTTDGEDSTATWTVTGGDGGALTVSAHTYFFWYAEANAHPLFHGYVDDGPIPNTDPNGPGATITVEGLAANTQYDVVIYLSGDSGLEQNAFRPIQVNGTWRVPGLGAEDAGALTNWGTLTAATRGADPALGVNALSIPGITLDNGTLTVALPAVPNMGGSVARAGGRACVSAIQLIPIAAGQALRDVAADAPWAAVEAWKTASGPADTPEGATDLRVRAYAPATLTLGAGTEAGIGAGATLTAEGTAALTLAAEAGATPFALDGVVARTDLTIGEGVASALGRLDIPVQDTRKTITLPHGQVPVYVASGEKPPADAYAYVQGNGNRGFIALSGGTPETPLRLELPDSSVGIFNGGLGELKLGADTVAELHLANDASGAHRNYVVNGAGPDLSTLRLAADKNFGFIEGQRITWLRALTVETPSNVGLWWRAFSSSADATVNLRVGGDLTFEPVNWGGATEALTFGTLSGDANARLLTESDSLHALTFTQTADTTYAGTIDPCISLTVAGTRTLTLTGTSDTAGNRALAVLEDATLRLKGFLAAATTTVEGTLACVGNKTLAGALTGAGRLVAESGTLNLAEADVNAFAGTVEAAAGATLALGTNRPTVAPAAGATLRLALADFEAAAGALRLPLAEGAGVPTLVLTDAADKAVACTATATGTALLVTFETEGEREQVWLAGSADWADGLPNYDAAKPTRFPARDVPTTVTLTEATKADTLTVEGDYTFAGEAKLSAGHFVLADGATLHLACPFSVRTGVGSETSTLGAGAGLILGDGAADAPETLPLNLSSTNTNGPTGLPTAGTVTLDYGSEATVKANLTEAWAGLTLACASDVCLTGDNSAFTGVFEVRAGATLRATGTRLNPFGTGTVRVLAGGTLDDTHSGNTQARVPNVEGAGDVLLGGGKPVLAGRVANTGTLTVHTATLMLADATIEGPDVTLNARLYPSDGNTTSALVIAPGKSLRGGGTAEVPLVFADGAILDLTAGTPKAEATIAYQGALTVRFADTEGATRSVAFAAVPEGLTPAALAALAQRADAAALAEVNAIALPGDGATAAEAAEALACFAGEGLVVADAEAATLAIGYRFSIVGLRTIGADEALLTAKAVTAAGAPLAYAEGATLAVSSATTLDGAWTTVRTAKPCDAEGRLADDPAYVAPGVGERHFRVPLQGRDTSFWRIRVTPAD